MCLSGSSLLPQPQNALQLLPWVSSGPEPFLPVQWERSTGLGWAVLAILCLPPGRRFRGHMTSWSGPSHHPACAFLLVLCGIQIAFYTIFWFVGGFLFVFFLMYECVYVVVFFTAFPNCHVCLTAGGREHRYPLAMPPHGDCCPYTPALSPLLGHWKLCCGRSMSAQLLKKTAVFFKHLLGLLLSTASVTPPHGRGGAGMRSGVR